MLQNFWLVVDDDIIAQRTIEHAAFAILMNPRNRVIVVFPAAVYVIGLFRHVQADQHAQLVTRIDFTELVDLIVDPESSSVESST